MINAMKICPVGTELFCADQQTNKMNLTVDFRNSANALNKDWHKNGFKLQRKLLKMSVITST